MIPLWDDIQLPPDYTLVDINGLEPLELRVEMQARALELWVEDTGGSFEDFPVRVWDDNEGMFAVKDAAGDIVGIQIIAEVADA